MAVVAQEADLFLIPLLNERHCVGQVIDVTDTAVLCAISSRQVSQSTDVSALSLSELSALMLIAPSAIGTGIWPIAGFDTIPNVNSLFNWKSAKSKGYANLAVHDPAVIEAFANAIFGLYPWDGFGAADFFSRFLIDPRKIPAAAVLTSGTAASTHPDTKFKKP